MNKLIINTLKPLNIPVKPSKHTGKEEPYIEFSKIIEQGSYFGDDEELETTYLYQLNLFGKGNLNSLEKEIVRLMKQAGFIRVANWDGPFENDTKLYHKIFRFRKYENTQ